VELPGRVLVADDNADMRDYLRRLLAPHWRVTAVTNGEAALEALRVQTYDVVLADVMMPRLDGFGLVRAIRASADLVTTPVILLSARAGEEARVEGLEAGADDYMVKPFAARELIARVRGQITLEHERARLRRLFDAAPFAVALLEGPELRFALQNALHRAIVGGKTTPAGAAWRTVSSRWSTRRCATRTAASPASSRQGSTCQRRSGNASAARSCMQSRHVSAT
jgi:CheY-like chemotaxis protein